MLTLTPSRPFAVLAPSIAAVLLWLAASGSAVEPAERFLDGLRERELYDLAIAYLQRMESSPLVTDEFKKRIPYEQGATLIAHAKSLAAASERSQKLTEAARQQPCSRRQGRHG